MNQIPPHQVWIGHQGEGSDFRKVFDQGIKALVHLAREELPPQPPRELILCHFPLLDGGGNHSDLLALAIRTTARLLRMHVPTLVFCSAGESRAPAVAAAALTLAFGGTAEDNLQQIVRHHPSDVSPGLWQEVTGVLASLVAEDKR